MLLSRVYHQTQSNHPHHHIYHHLHHHEPIAGVSKHFKTVVISYRSSFQCYYHVSIIRHSRTIPIIFIIIFIILNQLLGFQNTSRMLLLATGLQSSFQCHSDQYPYHHNDNHPHQQGGVNIKKQKPSSSWFYIIIIIITLQERMVHRHNPNDSSAEGSISNSKRYHHHHHYLNEPCHHKDIHPHQCRGFNIEQQKPSSSSQHYHITRADRSSS